MRNSPVRWRKVKRKGEGIPHLWFRRCHRHSTQKITLIGGCQQQRNSSLWTPGAWRTEEGGIGDKSHDPLGQPHLKFLLSTKPSVILKPVDLYL